MASALHRLCSNNSQYVEDTFETAFIYVNEAVRVLRQRQLISAEKMVSSITSVFSVLCRYIVFIGRHPKLACKVPGLVGALSEWGTAVVTVTYAVHTTQDALLRYRQAEVVDRFSSTMTTATLLSAFLESLYQYISERRVRLYLPW